MKLLIASALSILSTCTIFGCIPERGTPYALGEVEEEITQDQKQFRVDGTRIHMNDYISKKTPILLRKILQTNPQINSLVMHNVPGSSDDIATLKTGYLVHRHKLNTHLPATSEIVSGAVDLFLAGIKRTGVNGIKIGVHSWRNDNGIEGGDLPRNHAEHRPFLIYFRNIHVPEEFYWFTLKVAIFENIHWMNKQELERYNIFTISVPNPGN